MKLRAFHVLLYTFLIIKTSSQKIWVTITRWCSPVFRPRRTEKARVGEEPCAVEAAWPHSSCVIIYIPVRCLVLARARRRVYIVPLQSSLLQELCRWGTKSKAFDREAHRSVCIQLWVFASVLPAYVHQATGTTVVVKALKSIYHVTESTTRLVN